MRKTQFALSILGMLLPYLVASQHAPLSQADIMPYFPGCTIYEDGSDEKRQCSNQELIRYIANHIKYPEEAQKTGIEGTVLVQFVIDEKGQIMDKEVLRDIGGGCGEAALAMLAGMPVWEPAKNKGEYVKVKLNLPIQFFFKESNKIESDLYTINWGKLNGNKISKSDLIEHLGKNIIIRDPFGNAKPITELIFAYEKKRSYKEKKSRGKINKEMKNFVKKIKKDGQFSVIAIVQHEGSFVYVRKSYDLIK